MSAGGLEVVIHPDADLLAAAAAARLLTTVLDAQSARGWAHLVLTGGGVGTAVLAEVARSRARDCLAWEAVDLWWGDERFLPSGDPERNETGARAALIDGLHLPSERVHAMPGPDDNLDLPAACERYARELSAAGSRRVDQGGSATPGSGRNVPDFDLVLLGVGPDGHVASLFPGASQLQATGSVVAVQASPKPPPRRVSLTMLTLCSARQVWLLAAGEGKAEAVRAAVTGAPQPLPATMARGRERSLLLTDQAASASLRR